MKVILTESIPNLGQEGEVVNVKPGYGRNFLIPQSKAVLATPGALRSLENQRAAIEARAEEAVASAEELVKKIEKLKLKFEVKVGEEERIFGSVTNRNVADALAEEGIEVDRRNITLKDEIKTLGTYHAEIALLGDIKATVKLNVVEGEAE